MTAVDGRENREVFFEKRSDADTRNRMLIALGLSAIIYFIMARLGLLIFDTLFLELGLYFLATMVMVTIISPKQAWVKHDAKIVETFKVIYMFPVGNRMLDWKVINESLQLERTKDQGRKKKSGTIDAITSDGKRIRLSVETARVFD